MHNVFNHLLSALCIADLFFLGGNKSAMQIADSILVTNLFTCFYREMHNVFNHLLAALCIADLFFLGGNIVLTPIALGRPDIFNPGNFHPD